MTKLQTRWMLLLVFFLCCLPAWFTARAELPSSQPRIEVTIDPSLVTNPPAVGRLVVILSKASRPTDLRRNIGQTGMNAPPIFGTDVKGFHAQHVATLDEQSAAFPIASLKDLPAGAYLAQAVFMTNRDLNLPHAPGNLFSKPVTIQWGTTTTPRLTLTEKEPEEKLPPDTDQIKFLMFPSKLLSDFHGRPMVYRAAVILPADFAKQPERRYPLCVNIGGFGTRFTMARMMGADGRRANSDIAFVRLLLDGAGPFGDPYHVNSANNGPYGDALTQELIPYVEKTYRCIGQPYARFTTGASTGGWVSLALQLFYPDFFNGCWSSCPDPVDFRCYELINIYEDANAYVNRFGFERPAKRNVDGDTIYTLRHECQVENVLGMGDNWAMGGKDWASWNATFGPKGADGLPKPLWHPKTGQIDRSVTEHWKQYDLRLFVEKNWSTLGPKVNGKIHIWVGDADDYFLNNAVHRLKATFERQKQPTFQGTIVIAPRLPHTSGWSNQEIYKQMASRMNETAPR